MSLFDKLKSGAAAASQISSYIPIQSPAVGTFAKFIVPMAILTAQQYKIVRQELKDTENRIERMLLKHDLRILKKKESIFREIEHIASEPVTHRNIGEVKQQLAKLGSQLIRLEQIKEELELRKEKIRHHRIGKVVRNMVGVVKTKSDLRKLDTLEEELDLKEEHVLKIIENVLELIKSKELKQNSKARKHISRLEDLLKDIIKLTTKEVKTKKKEASAEMD